MSQRQIIGNFVLDLTQPHTQPQHQLLRHRGVGADTLEKFRNIELFRFNLRVRSRGGTTWAFLDYAHFADKLARENAAEDDRDIADFA